MRHWSLYTIVFILYITMQSSAYAQLTKYSNEYLKIGVSARAFALSNAYSAIADDASASYWNPACLPTIQGNRQLILMHAEYFAGIAKYDFGAFSAKIDKTRSLGISFIRFAVDDIPNTSELIDNEGNFHYDKLYSFSAADNAIFISYGKSTSVKGLNYGVTTKIIRRTAGDFASCWGFGFDAAIHYKIKKWNMAIMARDVSSTFNAWSYTFSENMQNIFTLTGNTIPNNTLEITMPSIVLGLAHEFNYKDKLSCLITTDLSSTFDGQRNTLISANPISIDPAAGIELSYKHIFFIRAGAGNVQHYTNNTGKSITAFQANVGLGINIKNSVIIDYALTDLGDNSLALYSNIISLRLNFNKKTNTTKL